MVKKGAKAPRVGGPKKTITKPAPGCDRDSRQFVEMAKQLEELAKRVVTLEARQVNNNKVRASNAVIIGNLEKQLAARRELEQKVEKLAISVQKVPKTMRGRFHACAMWSGSFVAQILVKRFLQQGFSKYGINVATSHAVSAIIHLATSYVRKPVYLAPERGAGGGFEFPSM